MTINSPAMVVQSLLCVTFLGAILLLLQCLTGAVPVFNNDGEILPEAKLVHKRSTADALAREKTLTKVDQTLANSQVGAEKLGGGRVKAAGAGHPLEEGEADGFVQANSVGQIRTQGVRKEKLGRIQASNYEASQTIQANNYEASKTNEDAEVQTLQGVDAKPAVAAK